MGTKLYVPAPVEEILVFDRCWERVSQFSLRGITSDSVTTLALLHSQQYLDNINWSRWDFKEKWTCGSEHKVGKVGRWDCI